MNRSRFEDLIKKSKERCLKRGMDCGRVFSAKMIDRGELQTKFSENRDLILTASPYMEHLISIVRGNNFFVLLTDKEGCILNAIGDEKILSEAFDLKMVAGSYMNEESIGTNAMSLVIKAGEPIQLSGEDHFIKAYHRWTCSGAPIKDINGNLIGVLDLTGYSDSVHPHTLGMVIAASNAIEEMLKCKAYNKIQSTSNKHIKTVFNAVPISILTSDIEGNIKICNQKALDFFGYKNNHITSNMVELIPEWEKIKMSIQLKNNISQRIRANTLKKTVDCQMTASSIYNPQGDTIEIILILKEERQSKPKIVGSPYYTFDKVLGKDLNFKKTVDFAKKIANNRSTILIMGESGTGKEVFAQSIHNFSKRMDEPFVALNCGAIPSQLIESELFGYEDGAYTGAKKGGNIGKFEQANNGTIMLDEIGEMPFEMQTRLLRVLQENVITRIGGHKNISIDVRIIAATNKDLKKEVEKGRFRKDLFYRLNVLPLYLPPMRERKDDIIGLFNHFLKESALKYERELLEVSDDDKQIMLAYHWPGNIRELKNVAELMVNTERFPHYYFDKNSDEETDNLLETSRQAFERDEKDSGNLQIDLIEKQHISKVLKIFKGNISQSAQALGIQRNTLYNKIKKYKIDSVV